MKKIVFFLLLLSTTISFSQDTLFTIDYPLGLISDKWEKSSSGRWFLVYPIDFPYIQYKFPKSRMIAIHSLGGENITFTQGKKVRPLLEYNKRTGRIFYSGALQKNSLSDDEVFDKLSMFQIQGSDVKLMSSFGKDSLHFIVKVELRPHSEQKEKREV